MNIRNVTAFLLASIGLVLGHDTFGATTVSGSSTQVTPNFTPQQWRQLQLMVPNTGRMTDYQRSTGSRRALINNSQGYSSRSSRSSRTGLSRGSNSRSSRYSNNRRNSRNSSYGSRNSSRNTGRSGDSKRLSFSERRKKRREEREKRRNKRRETRDKRREAFSRQTAENREIRARDKDDSGRADRPSSNKGAALASAKEKAAKAPAPRPIGPEELARALLIVGNIHLLNDRPGEARNYYRQLLDRFPESEFCSQAREKLSELAAMTLAGS